MKDEVLSEVSRRNMFLAPDALEIIDSNGYSMEFVNTLLNSLSKNTVFVMKSDVLDFLNGDKGVMESEKVIKPKIKRDTDISIIPGSDITGQSTCTGTIEDFTNYFRSRYNILKKIILKRRDFDAPLPISRAMEVDREVNIVGIIYEIKTTKNGHTMLEIEDKTGSCNVLIRKDTAISNELFVNDEVIGISGKRSKPSTGSGGKYSSKSGFFNANRIFRPDVTEKTAWTPSDSDSSIAFLSDIHIGSREFLKPQWEKMIAWLKANAYEKNLNYLVLPGDVVDGIGAYPDQEKDLIINNIFKQYETLSEYLKDIPDHMKIVMHPGNHDACRLAEPQPALKEIYTKSFDSNIYITGNPINLNVEGRVVTSYHGKSIDDWVQSVRGMSYEDPPAVMKQMIMRRHLAPMYGQKNALAPEKKDYLAMEHLPDIFVSGHVHGAGRLEYHGVKMINASSWQSQTDYQKRNNFNPDPAIMPVVHLGTGEITMHDFLKG